MRVCRAGFAPSRCTRYLTGVLLRGGSMQKSGLHTSFRLIGYLVALAVFGAILYSVAISITHWSGIGV